MKKYIKSKKLVNQQWNNDKMILEPCEPYLSDGIGSDSINFLDGRYSLETCIEIGYREMKLKHNKKKFISFEIIFTPDFLRNEKVMYKQLN